MSESNRVSFGWVVLPWFLLLMTVQFAIESCEAQKENLIFLHIQEEAKLEEEKAKLQKEKVKLEACCEKCEGN